MSLCILKTFATKQMQEAKVMDEKTLARIYTILVYTLLALLLILVLWKGEL